MKQVCQQDIYAPLNNVFLTAADIARWPEFLPNFRYNRFVEHRPSGGIVKTAYSRAGFNTNWVSEFYIDTKQHQLRFHHLESTLNASVGMNVIWDFEVSSDESVLITITHELNNGFPVLGIASGWLIKKGFINDMATQILAGLKQKVEKQQLTLQLVPAS